MIGRKGFGHGRFAAGLALAAAGLSLLGASAASAETYVVKGGEETLKGTEELNAAIAKANANPGANTIVLGSGGYLPSKVLKLTNTSGPLTIEGPAGTPTTKEISANINGGSEEPVAEIFLVESGVTVTFKNLYITGQGGEGYPAIEMLGANSATKKPGADVTIEDSTLVNTGASVAVDSGATLTARNATLSDGRTEGVIVESGGKADFFNSTIYKNQGAGINSNGGTVDITNTIVADNKGGDCIGGTTSDHSLDSDGSCGVGALSGTEPDLSNGLVDIGGPAPLHAVKAKSPVIGAGDPATCLASDERGAPRPGIKGDACDIGADEYSNTPPILTVPSSPLTVPSEGAEGAIVNFTPTAEGVDDTVGETALNCSPAPDTLFPNGETTVKCTAVDGHENKTTAEFKVIVGSSTTTTTTTTSSTTTTTEPTSTTTTTTEPTSTTTTTTEPTSTTTTTTEPTTTTTEPTTSTTTTEPTTTTTTTEPTTTTTTTTEEPTSTTTTTTEPTTTTSTTTTTTTQAPLDPSVTTLAPTAVAATTATLDGAVNPNGYEVTSCLIEYGESTSYTASEPCSPAPGAGTSTVVVTAAVTGLAPDTTYDYRVVATNAGGTVDGANETFTTPAETTTTTTTEPTSTTTTTSEGPSSTTTTTTEPTSTTTTTTEEPSSSTTTTTTTTEEPSSTTTTTTEPTTTTTTTTEEPTSTTTTTTEAPSSTTTTTTTTEVPTTTTTTTTTTSEEAQVTPIDLLRALQGGVESAPIPQHLRFELSFLLREARRALETPPPWFFPYPTLWNEFQQFRANGDLHVFVAVIELDQLTRHQIPPGLAHAGIELAKSIEALLERHPGQY